MGYSTFRNLLSYIEKKSDAKLYKVLLVSNILSNSL